MGTLPATDVKSHYSDEKTALRGSTVGGIAPEKTRETNSFTYPKRRSLMAEPNPETAIYRFYSSEGQLLYVGISDNPGHRFTQHEKTKTWWKEVSGISIEWAGTRQAALAIERRAIRVESPVYNIARHTPKPPKEEPQSCGHCYTCMRESGPCNLHYPHPDEDRIPCENCGSLTCLYALGQSDGIDEGMDFVRFHQKEDHKSHYWDGVTEAGNHISKNLELPNFVTKALVESTIKTLGKQYEEGCNSNG